VGCQPRFPVLSFTISFFATVDNKNRKKGIKKKMENNKNRSTIFFGEKKENTSKRK
jgi:hypothetical protein